MSKLKFLSVMVLAVMTFVACESNDGLMGPETSDAGATGSLGKGGNGGNGGGETAYTCTADVEWVGYNETDNPDYSIYEYTLWAGKHNDAGTVTITNNEAGNVVVTYNTNGTADLGEVHVYVWTDQASIPTKRPAPGHANYVVEDINADSYSVELVDHPVDCGSTLYISTHAALVGNDTENDESGSGDNAGETAYAGDVDSPACFDDQKGAWWGYVTYDVECFYNISGTVYEDADNSDDLEAGEAGFGGITVTATGSDGNVYTTITNDDGSYLFEHMPGGVDYVITSGDPDGDYLANENAGGYAITDLGGDVSDVDFGFVPLYDLSVALVLDGDMDCFGYSTITINGVEASSLENQLPGFEYVIVVTAYDLDGAELASETASGALYEDTALSLTLGGWVCPEPPVEECNDCVDGELVVNGSFEDGFSGWANNFGHSSSGYPIDRGTFWSTDGSYGIDLIGTGPSAPGYVAQTLCTVVGEEYVLSFDAEFIGSNGALVVTIDGNAYTVGSTGSHTIVFTATSSSTPVRFEANAYYDYLYNNVLLDNVSIACGAGNEGGDSNFPLWGQDISHVVLAFTPESAPYGDPIADGYYLIKVDNYPDAGDDDLDNDIDRYLAGLVGMDLLVGNYEMIGSSIKGGRQITSFYSYGSYNTNGEAADTPPSGFPLTYTGGSDNEGNQNQIDVTVNWSDLQ